MATTWIIILLIVIIVLLLALGIVLGLLSAAISEKDSNLQEWRRIERVHTDLILKIQDLSDVKITKIWRDSVEVEKIEK